MSLSKKALIIGVSRYDKLQSLELCENDAEELSRVLGGLGYEILDNYKLIGYVTLDAMKRAIQQFFKSNKREDTLLFYFSGHGLPGGRDRYYLAPSDADPNSLLYTGWSFDSLQYAIEESNSAKRLAILDCCFSGAAGEGVKGADDVSIAKIARDRIDKRMMESEGTYLLASSLAYQQSVIKKNLGHSLFTYYLLEGLKGVEGYKDNAGYVTADHLHNYVFDMITEKEKIPQKPIRKAKISGDIMVAYYPPSPKPRPEPEQVPMSSSSASSSSYADRKINEGDSYLRERDYENAVLCYTEATESDPTNHLGFSGLGKVLLDNKEYDDAIEAFKRAINAKRDYPDAYDFIGDAYFDKKDYSKALNWYDKALNLRKTSEFLKDKGRALYELKEYGKAITFLEEALQIKFIKKEVRDEVLKYLEDARNKRKEIDELEKGKSLYNSGGYDDALESFNRSLESNSKNTEALLYKGKILLHQLQFDGAIACFQEILKIDSTNKEALAAKEEALKEKDRKDIETFIKEGIRHKKNNDYQNAVDSFDNAITLDQNNYVPYSLKGDIAFELEEDDKAFKYYEKVIELEPRNYHAWYNKGEISVRKGEKILSGEPGRYVEYFNQAYEYYDKALDIDPHNPNRAEAWYKKGIVLEKLSEHDKSDKLNEAMHCYDKALDIKRDYFEAHYRKGQLLSIKGEYDKAIDCFDNALRINRNYEEAKKGREAAQKKKIDKETNLILDEGLKYLNEGEYENAKTSFDKAIAKNPNSAKAQKFKGDVLYRLEKYEEAIECYNKAVELDPAYSDAAKGKELAVEKRKQKEISLSVEAGLKSLKNKDYSKALSLFDESIPQDPKNTTLYMHKADALLGLNKQHEAIGVYNQILGINPKDVRALKYKGAALDRLGKYNQAIECFDKILNIDPKDVDAWNRKGLSLVSMTKPALAMKSFQKALEIDPTFMPAKQSLENTKSQLSQLYEKIKQQRPSLETKWTLDCHPAGITVDSLGNVFITGNKMSFTEKKRGRLIKRTESGVLHVSHVHKLNQRDKEILIHEANVNEVISGFSFGNDLGGIAVDSSGYIYVGHLSTNRIWKFDNSGKLITKWGSNGLAHGQFNTPADIAVDTSGRIYVVDKNNNRIQKFDCDGKFITNWGKFITNGESKGRDDGEFDTPEGIAIDDLGKVYVTDTYNNSIQKFDSNGKFITKWGSYGQADAQFNSPTGIAADNSGIIYVIDKNNNRIQMFDRDGGFITRWGSKGQADGQFDTPKGIAVDSTGNIYVMDQNRIQRFKFKQASLERPLSIQAKADLENAKSQYNEKTKKIIDQNRLSEDEWIKLLQNIADQKVIPFIGQQVDENLLPYHVKVAKELAEDYDYPFNDSHVLANVSQFVAVADGSEMTPKNVLSRKLERLEVPDFSLEKNRNTPYAILADLNLPIYVTTNYDTFLENALRSRGKNPVSEFCPWNDNLKKNVETDDRPSTFNKQYTPDESNPLVYHLYGDFNTPESMVLTEDDYKFFEVYLSQESHWIISAAIRKYNAESSLLSIGYNIEHIMSPNVFRVSINSLGVSGLANTLIMKPSIQSDIHKVEAANDYISKYAKKLYNLDTYYYNTSEFFKELGDRWRSKRHVIP